MERDPAAGRLPGARRRDRAGGPAALRSLRLARPTPPHNLPAELTSFVGREREAAQVVQLLSGARLLTLTGAPGVGKTRLARRVAAEVLDEYRDGVWLVELAALSDSVRVPQAVASVLGVREQPGRALVDTLAEAMKSRVLLLILDNCEHLLDACALLSERLLSSGPTVRLMATSRDLLGCQGETAWRVPSMTQPLDRRLSPERLLQFDGARLVAERARAVRPDFEVTAHNAAALAEICTRLDGIPLALELAAARVSVLTVEQIAARLDDRFRLLTGGARTALPRHRTLQAAVDWSYGLLAEHERMLLRRLAVFLGGCTLEAVEAVCCGEEIVSSEALDLLTQLVARSLVMVEDQHGVARYRLLETIRQYGLDRLREASEEAAVRRRHRDWYLGLAEQRDQDSWGPLQLEWLEWMEVERANLQAALAWSGAQNDEAELGLRLGAALWRFWELRGYFGEGREALAALLARAIEPTPARVLALHQLSRLTFLQGDLVSARLLLEQALQLARLIGFTPGECGTLMALGDVARQSGDLELATEIMEQALALARGTGLRVLVYLALFWRAEVARSCEDLEQAAQLLEEGLVLMRAQGDRLTSAWALASLAQVALCRRDLSRSQALHRESLTLRVALADRYSIALSLEGLGWVAGAQRRAERAARLLGAAGSLRESIGAVQELQWQAEHDRAVDVARAALGEARFAASWADGRGLTLEEAVAYAQADDPGPAAGEPSVFPTRALLRHSSELTRREREVACLIGRGQSNRQVARALGITERTAEVHARNIREKLGFTSRTQIAAWAVEQGLHRTSPPG